MSAIRSIKKRKLMKYIINTILLVFTACGINKSKEIDQIKNVLHTQQTAWNNGNIDAFMLGYWQSDSLDFTSTNGTVKGWQNTLDRYHNAYPNKGAMGRLKFDIIDVQLMDKTTGTLVGKWALYRENDNPKGGFTLIFKKINGDWLIINDVTTSE